MPLLRQIDHLQASFGVQQSNWERVALRYDWFASFSNVRFHFEHADNEQLTAAASKEPSSALLKCRNELESHKAQLAEYERQLKETKSQLANALGATHQLNEAKIKLVIFVAASSITFP